jgi:uncharacterized membrane protein YkvA (DUF1232 family)
MGLMIKVYIGGSYREVPWSVIVTFGLALAYVVSPVDAIPDYIPVAGWTDDAAVVAQVLRSLSDHIDRYTAANPARLEAAGGVSRR